MDKQEGLSINRAPRFKNSKYTFWNMRMEVYMWSLDMDMWKSIEDRYKFPKITDESKQNGDELEENCETTTLKTMIVDPANKKHYEWNVRAKNAILYRLADVEFTKVMHCTTPK